MTANSVHVPTVVINRQYYDEEMQKTLTEESTYQPLEKDPTPQFERKMNAQVMSLKRSALSTPKWHSWEAQQSGFHYYMIHLRCNTDWMPRSIHCVLHDSQAYKMPKYLATELTGPNGWTTSSYCTRELGAWYMKPSSSGCKRCQRMRSKCPVMCCLFYLLSIRSDCQSSPMGTKRLSIPLGKDWPVSRGRSGSSNPMSWCYIQTESGWWEAWTPLTLTYSNGD